MIACENQSLFFKDVAARTEYVISFQVQICFVFIEIFNISCQVQFWGEELPTEV